MTQFRPCIDLHDGQVKQIVGGSLNDQGATTNFVSQYDSAYYANLYREHDLVGGHVIALGPNNEQAVLAALKCWPNGLQFGGGVNRENAAHYLDAGASHVIVTSALFENDEFSFERLEA
ncbi:MAG: phosphoribosylformimino-5-aminoimidazole carboxamide ribotide isomerase, partial [Bermanella sp.]